VRVGGRRAIGQIGKSRPAVEIGDGVVAQIHAHPLDVRVEGEIRLVVIIGHLSHSPYGSFAAALAPVAAIGLELTIILVVLLVSNVPAVLAPKPFVAPLAPIRGAPGSSSPWQRPWRATSR